MTYIELHEQSPLAPECTDKYAVRQYVEDKGFADILVPLAGGPWSSINEIDFQTLPDACLFVSSSPPVLRKCESGALLS